MALGSTVAKNEALDSRYGSSKSSVAPATVYLALFNGDPTTTGTELTSTGGYVRTSIPNTDDTWNTASGGVKTNFAAINTAQSTGAWSSAFDHWGLYDSSSGGNLLDNGQILDPVSNNPTSITVTNAGSIVQFTANGIQITVT